MAGNSFSSIGRHLHWCRRAKAVGCAATRTLCLRASGEREFRSFSFSQGRSASFNLGQVVQLNADSPDFVLCCKNSQSFVQDHGQVRVAYHLVEDKQIQILVPT